MKIESILVMFLCQKAAGFWEMGTTTVAGNPNEDLRPRQSRFRWQMTERNYLRFFYRSWDWPDLHARRRLHVYCGLSIRFVNLGTGIILNRRTVLSAANLIEPHLFEENLIRIWAIGRGGLFHTPWRYRVWRARRVVPKSNNPEHYHGPRGVHVARHDVTVIHSMDQIYLASYLRSWYAYATRAFLTGPKEILPEHMQFGGSGFEDLLHIRENYKIYYARITRSAVVDCSRFLPKWWGKFICFRNPSTSFIRIFGVPNGGGLIDERLKVYGIGCFEIRYNEDRILVFTDLRYYFTQIHVYANISVGQYYEYAYQFWGTNVGWISDGGGLGNPFIPGRYKMRDLYPMGK